jgi:hypothetical protein
MRRYALRNDQWDRIKDLQTSGGLGAGPAEWVDNKG